MTKKNTATDIALIAAEIDASVAALPEVVTREDVSEADLQAITGELIALEATQAHAAALPAEAVIQAASTDFVTLMHEVSEDDRTAGVKRIVDAIDSRRTYETAKNPNNTSMDRTLKAITVAMPKPSIAAALQVVGVDPTVITRSTRDGAMMNVYAVQKMVDLLEGLAFGNIKNAINLAVMRSIFACKKEGHAFTTTLAQAAASDKVKVDKAIAQVLVRHTVSAATAPTQASSTLSALETLGIVKRTGSTRAAVWELTESPQTERLRSLLAA